MKMINNFKNSDKWFNQIDCSEIDETIIEQMNYDLAEELEDYDSIDDVDN